MQVKIPGGKKGFLTLVLIETVVITILALLVWGPENKFFSPLAGNNPLIGDIQSIGGIPSVGDITEVCPLSLTTDVIGTKDNDTQPISENNGMQPPITTNADESNTKTITINLVGDIMLASRVGEVIKEKGPDHPWTDLHEILSASDITLGNLECAVGSDNHQPVPDKQFTFLAAPEALGGAKNAGIDILTLANNHVLDYGPEAMLETIRHLEYYGIKHTGAGENQTSALKPVIINVNNVTVGVLAFSYVFPSGWWVAGENKAGLNSGYNYELVFSSVNELSKKTDITVVSLHWGRELADKPSVEQQKLARQLVEQGANIVIGHHPHVLQGLELYKNGLIAYSAGNFIFTLSNDIRGRQSMILQVDADSSGITAARVLPAWIEFGKTLSANEQGSSTVIRRLQDLSRNLDTNIDDRGEIDFNSLYVPN